jgi:hypothetical protein
LFQPRISNVYVSEITSESTKIKWDTDRPGDSLVKYGTKPGVYIMQKRIPANITSHNIKLYELTPNTIYYFVVNSTHASGNSNQSIEYNFTTLSIIDTVPPIANAGPDQTVLNGTYVIFNGTGSYDNVGIIKYAWDFDDRDGIGEDAVGVIITYMYPSPGIYNATLTVYDAANNSRSDAAIVYATGVTTSDVNVTKISIASYEDDPANNSAYNMSIPNNVDISKAVGFEISANGTLGSTATFVIVTSRLIEPEDSLYMLKDNWINIIDIPGASWSVGPNNNRIIYLVLPFNAKGYIDPLFILAPLRSLDTDPPASISNLQNTTGHKWINWRWNNPKDADFNHTVVYLEGIWQANTSNNYYNATELTPETSYEIGTHTVDNSGNINTTWVNQTTKTQAGIDTTPPSVTNPVATPPNIVADGVQESQLNVTVTDESGIASVNVDLSNIGGSPAQEMIVIPGTDVYTVNTTAAAGTAPDTYELQVNATDIHANANTSVSIALIVTEAEDTTPPVIESVTLDAYTTISDATIHVTVEATDNVGVTTVTADGAALVESKSIWKGNITAPSATGSYTLAIRAEDAAGNVAETTVDYSVVKPSGSIGIGVDPRLTTVSAGDTALITIKLVSTENFDDVAYVYLTTEGVYPGYEANLTWFNWTSTDVKVPAGAEVNVPLEVNIPAGESGYKMFYAKLESTKWTPTAMDTGILYTI